MIDRWLNSATRALGRHASDLKQISLPNAEKKMTDDGDRIMQMKRGDENKLEFIILFY